MSELIVEAHFHDWHGAHDMEEALRWTSVAILSVFALEQSMDVLDNCL